MRRGGIIRGTLVVGLLLFLTGSATPIAARPVAQPAPEALPRNALYIPPALVPAGWSYVAAASLTTHPLSGCLAPMTGPHNPETVLTDLRRAQFTGPHSSTLYQSVGVARSAASAQRLVGQIDAVFAKCPRTSTRVEGFTVGLTVTKLTVPLAQADATSSWALTGSKFGLHAEADVVAQAHGTQVVLTELARNGSDHARLQALTRLPVPAPPPADTTG